MEYKSTDDFAHWSKSSIAFWASSPVNFMGRSKPVTYFLLWNTKWNILKKNLFKTVKNNNNKNTSPLDYYIQLYSTVNETMPQLFYFFFT